MPIPNCPPRPTGPQTGVGRLETEIHVVTPMFGGGYEARNPDADFPIRPTAIRGHLQFWWRATHPAPAGMTSAELFAEHEKIWGSTKKKSLVSVQVELLSQDNVKPCAEWVRNHKDKWQLRWLTPFDGGSMDSPNPLHYVLFPFQGKRTDIIYTIPSSFFPKLKFKLSISFPTDQRDPVERALRAWINFGGLGSRTRRGCGSLYTKNWSFTSPQETRDWLQKNGIRSTHDWPTLATSLLHGETNLSPMDAWKKSVAPLQTFRQGEDVARNPRQHGDKSPKRSRFPEPETIRGLTNKSDPMHQDLAHPPGFPRAQFGMPIVVHFQSRLDPSDTTILPENGFQRMASPLILKALATGEDNAFPLILHLNTRLPSHVELHGPNGVFQGSTTMPVCSPLFGQIRNSPMGKHSSALDAFLDFAEFNNDFLRGGN